MNNKLLFGLVFLLIFLHRLYYDNKTDKTDIFKYSLMVHLDNDKVSEERIQKVKKIYDEYDLPVNLMKATHWNRDITELHTYPLEKTAYEFVKRPGAYGLAGSLYKCLKKLMMRIGHTYCFWRMTLFQSYLNINFSINLMKLLIHS